MQRKVYSEEVTENQLKLAKVGVHLDWETFSCSICLDLLKDPVTTSCGHSFCITCMNNHCDNQDDVCKCPHCREIFVRKPVLQKNIMLAALVEEMKRTGLQHSPADCCYAGPGDVACDVCTGRKLRAHKFCLVCLVHYCEIHLQNHYDVVPLEKHKLVEPSKEPQKWEIPPETATGENEARVGSSHSQANKNLLKKWEIPPETATGENEARVGSSHSQANKNLLKTVPFRGHITGGLHPGMKFSLIGKVDLNPDRFYIALTSDYDSSGKDITNVALEICVQLRERQVRWRSRMSGLWVDDTRALLFFPFNKGQAFKMEIFCERSRYRVFVDGEQLFDFKHRLMPLHAINTLWIKGSIVITKLA